MQLTRGCSAPTVAGRPCGATALRDADTCFWHSPDHAEEAQQARRLGGLRRRREAAVGGAYELDGISTPRDIQRLLEIAVTDTLELPNSLARNRTLGGLAQIALRAHLAVEQEARLTILEATVLPRTGKGR
jgi:hypothetical protein